MKRTIIILLVVLIIGGIAFLTLRNRNAKKVEKEERKIFGGLTRSQFTDKLKNAWRREAIQGTYEYIMKDGSAEAQEWRDNIASDEARNGRTRPFEEAVMAHAVYVSPSRGKAWDVEWSNLWLLNLVKSMGVNPDEPEVYDILVTI